MLLNLRVAFRQANLRQSTRRKGFQQLFGQDITRARQLLFAVRILDVRNKVLASHNSGNLGYKSTPDNANLVDKIPLHQCNRSFFNINCALVLVTTLARKDLDVDHRTFDARRTGQRRVLNITRLFSEDRSQQFLLRRQLRLTLGCYFANEDVGRTHFGSNSNDAAFIEVLQCFLRDVRNVAGNLLGTELGVSRFYV